MPTRLQLARSAIFAFLDQHAARVFRRRDLEVVLAENRGRWQLAQRTTFNEFLDYLTKSRRLRRLDFPFPHSKEIRYTRGEVPLFAALLTLKADGHFSHYTAVQMHDLTEQDPKTIYLNFEQPAKPAATAELEQGRIADSR